MIPKVFYPIDSYNVLHYIQGSKNISIKMLKDVGMIVPKSRETSAVYMQQARR